MKIKRYKKVQRYLSFYRNHFGFRSPYHVLLDGTFCQMALSFKVNITDQMPKYLGDKAKLLTTVCVVTETEKLGPALYGAMIVVKQFNVRKCGHEKNPISAAQCLLSLMKEGNNAEHYILATQDSWLSDEVRRLPGCPLLYMKHNAINFEKPSEVSQTNAVQQTEKEVEPLDHELETLQLLKRKELGESLEKELKKKKRKIKGPNPLSCKKKSKKKASKGEGSRSDAKATDEESQRKRRKRNKLPKHIQRLLGPEVE